MSGAALALRLAFRCQLPLELLARNLATDQACEGPQGGVGARGIILVCSRSSRGRDLDSDPVLFDRHRLQNPAPGTGQE